MFIVDDLILWLPVRGLFGIFEQIHRLADAELERDPKRNDQQKLMSYYAFAALRNDQKPHIPKIKLDDQRAFKDVRFENVKVAMGVVDSQKWDQKRVVDKLRNDPKWTKRNILTHDKIVGKIARDATVVPFRFATVFKDEEDVQAMLKKEHKRISKLLEKLDHKAEWSISVLKNTKTDQSDGHASKSGYDWYLEKKRSEKKEQRESERVLRAIDTFWVKLSKKVDDVREFQEFLESYQDGKVVFKAAVLLDKDHERQLVTFLEGQVLALKRIGLTIRVTGPWPPYSFV